MRRRHDLRADEDVCHSLGFGSRPVITGDVTQIDLPRRGRSGLIEAGDIFRAVNGIAFVHSDESDVVAPSPGAENIRAYDEHKTRQAEQQLSLLEAEARRAAVAR